MSQSVRKLVEELEGQRSPLPANSMKPPGYGGPQRDAINSVVDGIVSDVLGKIEALRKVLDEIEQQVREGASVAKSSLQDQVGICVRVNDEITHMRAVVEDIRASIGK